MQKNKVYPDTRFNAEVLKKAIACTHGHYNNIRYCNRPFSSTGEMDAAILANLNRKAGENDRLFFLGDFCKGGADQAKRYRDRILCKNVHFVEGNHDRAARKISAAFCSWNQLVEIRVGKQGIVLCHYAMRTWHHSSRGVWHHPLSGKGAGFLGQPLQFLAPFIAGLRSI